MNTELRRPAPHWTIEQLRKHFGMIPAARILRYPPPGTATEKDALKANEQDGHICELIDGTLVEKAVGANESRIAAVLLQLLGNYLDKHALGALLGESGFIRIGPGNVRAPDVSFFRFSSLPGGVIPEDIPYPDLVPDFAVEVLSKTNTTKEIARKVEEFFRAGTTIIWIIDPRKKSARVHTSPKDYRQVEAEGTLDAGPVLPGFSVSLERLFTQRRPPEPKS
jgi:Uma2 family endonuclease